MAHYCQSLQGLPQTHVVSQQSLPSTPDAETIQERFNVDTYTILNLLHRHTQTILYVCMKVVGIKYSVGMIHFHILTLPCIYHAFIQCCKG